MRRAAKVDSNHCDIVQAFLRLGCSVQDLHRVGGGCPDLLVGIAGRVNILVEIKQPAKRKARQGGLQDNQVEFMKSWRGWPIAVVYSVDDVVQLVNATRRGDGTN